ncbi:MAG: UDP-N-acetylmuramoyl-L-alanine--D-glutamate ligase [Chitinophagaceae bacterium]
MGKRLVILGAAESGVGAAILGKQQGFEVFVSDGGLIKDNYKKELVEWGIEFEEGSHTEEKILQADEVIKSPGIPEKNETVRKIRAKGIEIISEIEFAYRYSGNSKIVGITGSNGKTTTTSLLYHICQHAGLNCAMVGNIGYSFARQVAIDPKGFYIVEISSFQLDDIKTFRADIAILTNITEDHLDRYEYKFENYINSKFRITMNQTAGDYFIYSADDPVTKKYLDRHVFKSNLLPFTMQEDLKRGAFIKDDKMTIKVDDETFTMSILDFTLRGKHNRYNTMAAGITGVTLRLRKDKIREAIQSFESLEHRMEYVATVRGVEFMNDSKATNVNSTWYALENMEKPTILILGGIDKGNDYSEIMELVKEKVKAIVCMGIDNRHLHETFDNVVENIVDAKSAVDAVKAAWHFATKGDIVLLSPACASFDLFRNYEDRGKQFKQAVKEL